MKLTVSVAAILLSLGSFHTPLRAQVLATPAKQRALELVAADTIARKVSAERSGWPAEKLRNMAIDTRLYTSMTENRISGVVPRLPAAIIAGWADQPVTAIDNHERPITLRATGDAFPIAASLRSTAHTAAHMAALAEIFRGARIIDDGTAACVDPYMSDCRMGSYVIAVAFTPAIVDRTTATIAVKMSHRSIPGRICMATSVMRLVLENDKWRVTGIGEIAGC